MFENLNHFQTFAQINLFLKGESYIQNVSMIWGDVSYFETLSVWNKGRGIFVILEKFTVVFAKMLAWKVISSFVRGLIA